MEGERVLHQVNRPTHENMKNASPLSTCSGFVLLLVVLALCGGLVRVSHVEQDLAKLKSQFDLAPEGKLDRPDYGVVQRRSRL